MATLFDRMNREFEALGRRAQEVFDESRARLELMRLRNLRDGAARELGYLFYERERQPENAEQGRLDAALFKMDDLKHEIERVEQQLAVERVEKQAEEEPEMAAAGAATAEPAGQPDATEGPPPAGETI